MAVNPEDNPDSVFLKKVPEPENLPPIKLTEEELKGFVKAKPKIPDTRPFIDFPDLNNMNEQDILNCNPRRPSIEIGIKGTF